jgi:putative ABC transport system permease protein
LIDSLYIAWKYIRYYRLRTLILVACITLIAALPLSLQLLLEESEQLLLSRAESTPLVVGAKGSALDLAMNTLYFSDEVPQTIVDRTAAEMTATGLATGIPLHIRFQARGYPIVGTTLDYFEFRTLQIASGRPLVMLGECVLGAQVASELGLAPGDSLVSSPETVFDLAGIYPLKMRVVGVLEQNHSPDDLAVFVDIRTAWVIEGLGHGHEDVTRTSDASVLIERTESNVTANAKLLQYTEITEANRDAFHFHGDTSGYPLTAVLAVPADARSGTILRGRYLEDSAHQIIRPRDIIDGLLENIFQIKDVIDGVIIIVGLATLLAIVLVFALSIRLRARELDTIFRLGCSRLTSVQLLVAEMMIIAVLSGVLVVAALLVVNNYASELVRLLIIR